MDTRLTLTIDQKTRLAEGYLSDGRPAGLRTPSSLAPAGDLLSTTPELLKFVIANMDLASGPSGDAFGRAQKRYATGTKGGDSGLGWEIDRPGTALESLWKDGGDSGATSQVWICRGLNYCYGTADELRLPAAEKRIR